MQHTGFDGASWLNEPPRWSVDDGKLTLVTAGDTDFWRETYYGFVHDNGHALTLPVDDGFTAEVRVRADFRNKFDQAGMFLELDGERWLKCGVELTDGELFLSVVVTDRRSDWSVSQPFAGLTDFRLRMTVESGAIRIHASKDGDHWTMLRLATFPAAERYRVGVMACSPITGGLEVTFTDFRIGPASTEPLHAD